MTRNAKVGEYIIVNATERLDYWGDLYDYLINNKNMHEVKKVFCEEFAYIKRGGTLFPIAHKDYTLVEDTIWAEQGNSIELRNVTINRVNLDEEFNLEIPNRVEDTMKAEDIDLSVDQVFVEPLDGFEFTDCEEPRDSDWLRYFLKGVMSANGKNNYWDERLTCWKYCRPIAKPEPKTRPMTNLEVFQLMPIGTVLWQEINDPTYIFTEWGTGNTPKKYNYTVIDQAFKELKTIDDIEWMKMEVKE